MNWNETPKKAVALAYISKKSDPAGEQAAQAMKKTMLSIMREMKQQNLLFSVRDYSGNMSVCKASVKAAAALDHEHGQQIMLNGKQIMSYPPIMDENGNPLYIVTATIYNGSENLTLFGGRHVNDAGMLPITSIRWGWYNTKNPAESMSAKGVDEINENSHVSDELKKLANALEIGGYIRDYDCVFAKTVDSLDIARAMRRSVKPLIQHLKKVQAMPALVSQSGKQYYGAAYITVQQDKTRTEKYWVRAGIRRENDTLFINAGCKPDTNGFLPLYSISFQQYDTVSPSDSIRYQQDEILQPGNVVPDDFKQCARAIMDSGYLSMNTELKQFAYTLNTEYFKEHVKVQQKLENGSFAEVEKKMCSALYRPETPAENGKTWPEQVTIFNRKEPDILVTLTDSDSYGHSVRVVNLALTEDENGIHKRENGDPAAAGFITDNVDISKYLPDMPELVAAVREWLGLVTPAGDPETITAAAGDFEEILSDGEVSF